MRMSLVTVKVRVSPPAYAERTTPKSLVSTGLEAGSTERAKLPSMPRPVMRTSLETKPSSAPNSSACTSPEGGSTDEAKLSWVLKPPVSTSSLTKPPWTPRPSACTRLEGGAVAEGGLPSMPRSLVRKSLETKPLLTRRRRTRAWREARLLRRRSCRRCPGLWCARVWRRSRRRRPSRRRARAWSKAQPRRQRPPVRTSPVMVRFRVRPPAYAKRTTPKPRVSTGLEEGPTEREICRRCRGRRCARAWRQIRRRRPRRWRAQAWREARPRRRSCRARRGGQCPGGWPARFSRHARRRAVPR